MLWVYPLLQTELDIRKGKSIDEDQSYINKICKGKVYTLDPRYNFQHAFFEACQNYNTFLKKQYLRRNEMYDEKIIKEAKRKLVIVHFTNYEESRPWRNNCKHEMREKWIFYKNCSPWSDYQIEEYESTLTGVVQIKKRVMHYFYMIPIARKVYVKFRYGFWT